MNPQLTICQAYLFRDFPQTRHDLRSAFGQLHLDDHLGRELLPVAEIAVKKYLSLVSKIAQLAAVRATPVNGVAGHAPQIFLHALRAYLKTAATVPTEGLFLYADVAGVLVLLLPFGPWSGFYCLCFHGKLHFPLAMGLFQVDVK
jgi:hypothetical protein